MKPHHYKPRANVASIAAVFLFMIIITTAIHSCAKDTDPGPTNWWFRSDLVSGGIKTIDYDFYTYHYDKNGHEIHIVTSVDEWFYEYNSNGLRTKQTYINQNNGDTIKEVTVYEYNNKGKFVQLLQPDVEGVVLINYNYLIPDLSRVMMTTTRNGEITHSGERLYEFHGDRLLIIQCGLDNSYRDTTVVVYKGNYPYECNRDKYCFGPVSYQQDGMFSEFRRVFKNYDGSINMEVTFCYRNNNGRMLLDKKVTKGRSGGTETIFYTYDDNGNPIRDIVFSNDNLSLIAEYSYVFDSKGNWIQKTETYTDIEGNQLSKPITETRSIEYW